MMFNKIGLSFLISVVVFGMHISCTTDLGFNNLLERKYGLKDAYQQYFSVGVAVGPSNLKGDEMPLIKQHFNSLTAENAMKMAAIQPKEGVFKWAAADSIVDFATKNKMKVRGHTLVWHNYMPEWFFIGPDGKEVSKELLLSRLKKYITAVVTRYKGKVYAWDVVNEVIDDDPKNYLRRSKWCQIAGEDFIVKAFEYAHEADPSAQLFYNDYNAEKPDKLESIYRLLKNLKDKGVQIHGMGLQSHWNIYDVNEANLKAAIEKYNSLGLRLHFTEVDMSVYPWEPEPREKRPDENDSYTPEIEKIQTEKYGMVFRVFRQYEAMIDNVTFWNVSDRHTWLDSFLVKGRKDYPLLFDAQLNPKKAYWEVVSFK